MSVIESAFEKGYLLREAILSLIKESEAMKPPGFAAVYQSILSRVKVRSMFEIGIHKGGSIRMWRSLLGPDANISCLDINSNSCLSVANIANHIYEGSQTDPDLLHMIGKEAGPFDIIIDDGSHQNPHMIYSFENLFEFIRPGGSYVIEDMFTSYWPKYKGGLRSQGTLVEYLKNLVDEQYAKYISDKYTNHYLDQAIPDIERSSLASQIDSIEFFSAGIVSVNKQK